MAFSQAQFHHRGATAALVLRRLGHGADVGMLLQGLAQSLAEDAHTTSVHYANPGQAGKKSAIDKFLHFAGCVVDVVANYIDFRRSILIFIFE